MALEVVTRFPPSPTGTLHIGSARTALFNYLYAKQHGGRFLVRLEDTDRERSKKKFKEDILSDLDWLGIHHDGAVLRQSERTDRYAQHLETLIENGSAYSAEPSEKGSGHVVRFKNPNARIAFTDLIRGEVTFNTTELGDFIIARSEREPLYHLAVVTDDIESDVTHVIRGEDLISSTPRQILILEALGATRPTYAHIPLILAPDRSKLSKRHGAVSIGEYRAMGVLPGALINYLALLGWHPEDDRELFSLDELLETFDLTRVQKGGASFDMEKLKSINRTYLEKLSDREFLEQAQTRLPEPILKLSEAHRARFELLLPLLRERIEIFSDITRMADSGELTYFFETPSYSKEMLVWKEDSVETTRSHLERVVVLLEPLSESAFTYETAKSAVWEYARAAGRGSVLWPLRIALSGRERSPDPFQIASIIGKEETLERVHHAIKLTS